MIACSLDPKYSLSTWWSLPNYCICRRDTITTTKYRSKQKLRLSTKSVQECDNPTEVIINFSMQKSKKVDNTHIELWWGEKWAWSQHPLTYWYTAPHIRLRSSDWLVLPLWLQTDWSSCRCCPGTCCRSLCLYSKVEHLCVCVCVCAYIWLETADLPPRAPPSVADSLHPENGEFFGVSEVCRESCNI